MDSENILIKDIQSLLFRKYTESGTAKIFNTRPHPIPNKRDRDRQRTALGITLLILLSAL